MSRATFSVDAVSIEIVDAEDSVALVVIETPVGTGRLLGRLRFEEKVLYIEGAHVEGLVPGALGRRGINVVLRKILPEADVERIVIQGARRTTGAHLGQVPTAIVFPGRGPDRTAG